MPTYRMTIDRTVRFQLDVEATDRLEALRMVNDKALMYDDRDLKETRVIAIKELEKVNVLHPFD
jgi:hypothetical protein